MAKSLLDYALLIFFITHIPITMFMDSQALLQPPFVLEPAVEMIKWYTTEFKDPYMRAPFSVWFQSLVAMELLVQLPFFFVATYALINEREWIRTPSLLYGAHVCTTVVPILAEVMVKQYPQGEGPSTLNESLMLAGFYFPYFLLPFMLMIKALTADSMFSGNTNPNTNTKKTK